MQPSPNVANKRILVVDDELQNRKLLQAFLKKLGEVQVVEAQNGEEAVHQAQEQAPDLILMDIMMPGMDGFEACSRIKQEPSTQDVPVIFLSALTDVQSKTEGFAAGGVDYVSKPFEAKELHSRVLAHLALKEQADMLQGRSEWLETEVQKRTRELEASKEELSRHYAYLQNINDMLSLSLQEKPLAEVLEKGLDIVLQSSWLPTDSSGWMYLHNTTDCCFEQVAVRNPDGVDEPQCAELAENVCNCRQELGVQEIITSSEQHQAYKCEQCPKELCCVPIVFELQVLGLLVFRLPDRHELSPEEEGFLKSIARTLAGIIVRKRTEITLQESEAWYRALFETTQSATYILEDDGRVGQVNSAFSELAGLSQEAIEGRMYWSDFVHEKDLQMVGTYREMRREDPESAPGSYEFRFITGDGQIKQVMATVDKIPGTGRTVISLLDLTERKHFEQELERKALYDTLTGLPNRALFRSIISRLLTQSEADNPHYFAVLFLDLDRFSLLNESLGHQSGDRLLVMAAQRLQEEIGHKGTVCRIGSDEFVVVLDAVHDYSEVIIHAENIRKRINEPFVLDEQTVHTTCCIGIVKNSAQDQYESADDLIRNAEIAMHRAKQEGANTLKD
ncbi:MAG: diguanylate cyclase, partial [Desulfohalobium sp.]